MVHQSMWREEQNNVNAWQWPQQEMQQMMDSVGDNPPMMKSKVLKNENKMSLFRKELPVIPSDYAPLSEPSPLGLRLKKSPSLLELIQARLSQSNNKNVVLPLESMKVEIKKKVKAKAGASGSVDKLKASNFPASFLKIGQWEYVSKNEGDLVAKCYFAKHKLVWEVLDGGLKSKIEIQWEDIVGLEANCQDKGPGSLTVVLGKPPLFFRETNPQPRKHTLWESITDFTNGEASTFREHHLQCAQGVLNKHYEKLIQCDTRLKFLSQQLDPVLDLPFAPKACAKDQILSQSSQRSSASTLEYSSTRTEEMRTFGLARKDYMEEYCYVESSGLMGPKTMSVSDVVNHIGHCISEKKPNQVLPFSENVSSGVNQNDMLGNISQISLSDNHLTTTSDEKNLMSRVNSLRALLQDGNDYMNVDNNGNNQNDASKWVDGNDYHVPDCNPPEIEMGQGREEEFGMSRNNSSNDLLHLPRISSL